MVLVGNQKDREGEREVSKEEAERFVKENKIDLFMETSAKTSENVQQTFILASKMLYRRHLDKINLAKKNLQDKMQTKRLKKEKGDANLK